MPGFFRYKLESNRSVFMAIPRTFRLIGDIRLIIISYRIAVRTCIRSTFNFAARVCFRYWPGYSFFLLGEPLKNFQTNYVR